MVNFKSCFMERATDLIVGLFIIGLGLLFTVVSFTVLPVIGLFLAIPVLLFSLKFIAAPHGKSCSFK